MPHRGSDDNQAAGLMGERQAYRHLGEERRDADRRLAEHGGSEQDR
jgi:hypothetical protein